MKDASQVAARQVTGAQVQRRGNLSATLWWRGSPLPADRLRVAVVGSRQPSAEQLSVAQTLGRELAQMGVVVVSGGAVGIDTAALDGALSGVGERTVAPLAVLPASLDHPFPAANAGLFARVVAAGGALCSRIAPGDAHCRGRFHARNDLLVTIVDAVIAVCADRPSGTLHCARCAWRRQVPVLAVPWSPASRCSAGTNSLLELGARAVLAGESLQRAMATLQSEPASLLVRASEVPHWPKPQARQLTIAHETFDAPGNAWPCYTPCAAPPALGHGDPPGCDGLVVARLREVLTLAGSHGMTVDELAAASQISRAVVAATVLGWTLHGGVKRVSGSWYALETAPRS